MLGFRRKRTNLHEKYDYPWWRGDFGVAELLITLLLFVTAPVSANLLAKAAMHLQVPSKAGDPPKSPQR